MGRRIHQWRLAQERPADDSLACRMAACAGEFTNGSLHKRGQPMVACTRAPCTREKLAHGSLLKRPTFLKLGFNRSLIGSRWRNAPSPFPPPVSRGIRDLTHRVQGLVLRTAGNILPLPNFWGAGLERRCLSPDRIPATK